MSNPLPKKAFMQHVANATKEAGFTVEKIQGERLHVVLDGQTNRLNLATAYNAYCNAPERLEDIVKAHLSVLNSLAQVGAPAIAGNPGDIQASKTNGQGVDAAELLLPVLQQKSWLADMADKVNSMPVNKPFVTGLIVAYVIDTPAFRTYLNEDMLARVEGAKDKNTENLNTENQSQTLQEVHEAALGNLRTLVKNEMQIDTFNSFAETIITCETREGYASSCILLPELMEEWSKRIPGDMLIGIPNRDFIIAFSHKHPAGVEGIEAQTLQDSRTKERPLTGRLLKWKDGQAREFRPLN